MKTVSISLNSLRLFAGAKKPTLKDDSCIVSEYIKSLGYYSPQYSPINGHFTAFKGNEMTIFLVDDEFINTVYHKGTLLDRTINYLNESQRQLVS